MNEPGVERTIIEINGLTKTYQVGDVPVHALRGVDLEIRKREFVAIIGASGSGKSTLFHVLGGLTPGYLRNCADQWTRSGGHVQLRADGSSQDHSRLCLSEVQSAAYAVRGR